MLTDAERVGLVGYGWLLMRAGQLFDRSDGRLLVAGALLR